MNRGGPQPCRLMRRGAPTDKVPQHPGGATYALAPAAASLAWGVGQVCRHAYRALPARRRVRLTHRDARACVGPPARPGIRVGTRPPVPPTRLIPGARVYEIVALSTRALATLCVLIPTFAWGHAPTSGVAWPCTAGTPHAGSAAPRPPWRCRRFGKPPERRRGRDVEPTTSPDSVEPGRLLERVAHAVRLAQHDPPDREVGRCRARVPSGLQPRREESRGRALRPTHPRLFEKAGCGPPPPLFGTLTGSRRVVDHVLQQLYIALIGVPDTRSVDGHREGRFVTCGGWVSRCGGLAFSRSLLVRAVFLCGDRTRAASGYSLRRRSPFRNRGAWRRCPAAAKRPRGSSL